MVFTRRRALNPFGPCATFLCESSRSATGQPILAWNLDGDPLGTDFFGISIVHGEHGGVRLQSPWTHHFAGATTSGLALVMVGAWASKTTDKSLSVADFGRGLLQDCPSVSCLADHLWKLWRQGGLLPNLGPLRISAIDGRHAISIHCGPMGVEKINLTGIGCIAPGLEPRQIGEEPGGWLSSRSSLPHPSMKMDHASAFKTLDRLSVGRLGLRLWFDPAAGAVECLHYGIQDLNLPNWEAAANKTDHAGDRKVFHTEEPLRLQWIIREQAAA